MKKSQPYNLNSTVVAEDDDMKRKIIRTNMKKAMKTELVRQKNSMKQLKNWFSNAKCPRTLHNMCCVVFDEKDLMTIPSLRSGKYSVQ